ncbi:uncharacterized protein LOC107812754 isoform X1 [Nicotiana tabacum]|uniref:Pulmonary surfactant-associated protein B n=2 Tax=Nicotiana tabacum TaxID=4097 RepID=A0A1S4BX30_TOBAC|nr:PREDICTED: prosaposin-like isoform X1 [Nicotiana tabacum]XP_018623476.1 prosaposin-like [Nicotiana tomentosiformis]
MDFRVCLCLFILGSSWCCTARELSARNHLITETEYISVLQINNLEVPRQVQPPEEVGGNEQLCTLCEEYTAKALKYMANYKTQTEIIDHLHESCLKMSFYKQECVVLVDYYAPLFFSEINKIRPEDFCEKFDLCERVVTVSQVLSGQSCDLCHQVVTEAESKLKDPDTQLEILELLLKACEAVKLKPYARKCKKLIFEYAPVILVNAEQFLEKNDVCAILHDCEPAADKELQASPKMQASLHSAS